MAFIGRCSPAACALVWVLPGREALVRKETPEANDGVMSRPAHTTGALLIGTASSRAISLGFIALATTLMMRKLGPEQTGAYYVLITVATTAVSLGHLSLMHAYVFLWSRGDDRVSLGANASWLGIASGCLTAGVAWVLVNVLGPDRIPLGGRYDLLLLALLAVPASIVVLHLSALLALDNRIGRVNAANVVGALVPFGAAVLLYATSRLTLTTALLVWVWFSLLPAFGVITAFGRRRAHLSVRLALEAVTVGLKYHIAAVSLFLLLRVDIFLLNANVSAGEVGRYALAVALVELTFVFTDSLAQVILPRQVASPLRVAGAYTARVMRASLVVSVVVVSGLIVGGYHFVPLIFGEAFRGSAGAILSLAPGIVAFAMVRTLGGVLIRLDRPFVVSGATTAALAVNVVLNLVLIPRFGIVGAGLASSAAYSILAIFYTVWLLRATSLPGAALVPRMSDFSQPVAATGVLYRARVSRWRKERAPRDQGSPRS